MSSPIEAKVVTLTFIQNSDSGLYLQQRYNTGFMDGCFDVPSGKVDQGETLTQSAQRELFEEAGVLVAEADLECFHAYLNTANEGSPFIGFMFRAAKWCGNPKNKEPQKCSQAGFIGLDEADNLRLTPMVRDGISKLAIASSIELGYYGLK